MHDCLVRRLPASAALTLVRCGAIWSWALAPGQLPLRQIAWSRSFRRMASGTAEAELVALGVGQDDPVPVTLADVCLPCAKGEQTAELGRLIAADGFDVQVQPVLGELRLIRHKPEIDLERATVDPDRHAVATALHDLPAQRPGPELREQLRVCRVDDQGNDSVLHLYVLTHRKRT